MTMKSLRNSISLSDESLHVLCDPCRFNGKTTVAMKYCRDCSGHLCPNCVNTHLKITNTKNHHVSYIITKRSQNNASGNAHVTHVSGQSPMTSKVPELKCTEHGKNVVSFCSNHDALCCRVCIGTNHRECKLVVSLRTSLNLQAQVYIFLFIYFRSRHSQYKCKYVIKSVYILCSFQLLH